MRLGLYEEPKQSKGLLFYFVDIKYFLLSLLSFLVLHKWKMFLLQKFSTNSKLINL